MRRSRGRGELLSKVVDEPALLAGGCDGGSWVTLAPCLCRNRQSRPINSSARAIHPASGTTFLSVKKFRMSRVQNGALIAGTILFIGTRVWCALYFFL